MKKISFLFRLAYDIVTNSFTRCEVVLISENSNWVIDEECINVKKFLESQTELRAKISITPAGLQRKIIHFFSINTFLDNNGPRSKKFFYHIHSSNKVILTWFHISENEKLRLKYIPLLNSRADIIHTASRITKEKLVKNGVFEEKIRIIPLGVDTTIFKPAAKTERAELKKKLHLPEKSILIGSFQKDGIGWGRGLEPKLIKGPDIFCDVVEKLSKKYPVHVLLTGPARGYVKKRLAETKVPYSHTFLEKYSDIVSYYQVLDLYLICSREEGGPKAILESMAVGVPAVSTRVGMIPDIVEDGISAFIVDIGDTDAIIEKASLLIENEKIKDRIASGALKRIRGFDLLKIGQQFYEIYNKLK